MIELLFVLGAVVSVAGFVACITVILSNKVDND